MNYDICVSHIIVCILAETLCLKATKLKRQMKEAIGIRKEGEWRHQTDRSGVHPLARLGFTPPETVQCGVGVADSRQLCLLFCVYASLLSRLAVLFFSL